MQLEVDFGEMERKRNRCPVQSKKYIVIFFAFFCLTWVLGGVESQTRAVATKSERILFLPDGQCHLQDQSLSNAKFCEILQES